MKGPPQTLPPLPGLRGSGAKQLHEAEAIQQVISASRDLRPSLSHFLWT